MKKRINVLVTDLDDTLWDWLYMWHSSFEPYMNRISKEFSIPLGDLKNDFRNLHKSYGTTESSFIYKELKLLSEEQKNKIDDRDSDGKSILHEYYSLKKNSIKLYPGVLETLKKLKDHGVLIVAFTESNAFFTKYRLKHLELDGLIDFVYSPIDSGKPDSVDRVYSEDFWEPKVTKFRYLPKSTLKPAPEILEIILRDCGADKQNTVYIGDKLDKDVFMAKQAGVFSIYAKYGSHIDSEKYQLLKEVSHWSDEDIQREIEFKKSNTEKPIPDITFDNSFKELLSNFEFFPFNEEKKMEKIGHVLTIWQKTIDVQQHFNDIELRIRNIALTTFTFIIGGIGFLEKEKSTAVIEGFYFPYSSALAFIGILIMFGFFYMDRAWYHKLLIGAVKQGLFIESRWGEFLPEINLTHTIGKESPHRFLFKWKVHSKNKYYIFYGLLFTTLLVIAIVLLVRDNCFR